MYVPKKTLRQLLAIHNTPCLTAIFSLHTCLLPTVKTCLGTASERDTQNALFSKNRERNGGWNPRARFKPQNLVEQPILCRSLPMSTNNATQHLASIEARRGACAIVARKPCIKEWREQCSTAPHVTGLLQLLVAL
jgi:hypothetical protein